MKLLYATFWLLFAVPTLAQSPWRGGVEVGGLLAGPEAQIPLWLRANQWGTVPLTGSFGTLRADLSRDYAPAPADSAQPARRFDWGVGVRVVGNAGAAGGAAATYLPDAFVKVRWGKVELWGGNRREVVGLGDTLLTSGFLIWSGNAPTFPKLQLHTPGYVSVPLTRRFVAFRAGYAHGWLVNTYVRGSFLHQKYFYARFGKPQARLQVTAGLNHHVQWAGYADYLIGTPIAIDGQMPNTLRDYLYVITGTYPEAFRNDRLTEFDGENRVGNHLGSIDFALDWRRKRGHWRLYYQHMYDDASGLAFRNALDGLKGISYQRITNPSARFQVRRATLEWLDMTDQSGPSFDIMARWQGADNYFNHAQYRQGWSYQQRAIGTPLVMPVTELGPVIRTYENAGFFPNNRVVAWYGAVQAGFRSGPLLTLRASFQRGFGTYAKPYPVAAEQVSAAAALQWPLGTSLSLNAAVALDRGDLLPVSTGGYVGLRWGW